MSGIDEQNRDVTPCGCEKYKYWTMFENETYSVRHLLGYLNPDSWLIGGQRKSINKLESFNRLSKDDFINKIGVFYCECCKRKVKKGDALFEKLCSDVEVRWAI